MDGCSVAQCTQQDFVKDSVKDSVKESVKEYGKDSGMDSVKDFLFRLRHKPPGWIGAVLHSAHSEKFVQKRIL